MSLDERMRTGLRHSAEAGRLDEARAFDDVLTARDRHITSAHVARQAGAAIMVAVIFAAVAILVSWRTMPTRYRSVATVSVAASPTSPAGLPWRLTDPVTLALTSSARQAALRAAGVSGHAHIVLTAKRLDEHRIELTATAPDARDASAVPGRWAVVLAGRRKEDANKKARDTLRAVEARIKKLHRELRAVDAKLAQAMPKIYGDVQVYDGPNGNAGETPAPPPVPENGSVQALNLAFERIQIINDLNRAGRTAGRLRIAAVPSNVSTTVVAQTPASEIASTPPATRVALGSLLLAVALILLGAYVVYRRRTRASRDSA